MNEQTKDFLATFICVVALCLPGPFFFGLCWLAQELGR